MKSSNNDSSEDASSGECYASVPDLLWRHHKQLHLPPNNIQYNENANTLKFHFARAVVTAVSSSWGVIVNTAEWLHSTFKFS